MHILSFLLQNMFIKRNFHIQKIQKFKNDLNVSKLRGKFHKIKKKNTKLKEKTQALGGFSPAWETKWCYKKKPVLTRKDRGRSASRTTR